MFGSQIDIKMEGERKRERERKIRYKNNRWNSLSLSLSLSLFPISSSTIWNLRVFALLLLSIFCWFLLISLFLSRSFCFYIFFFCFSPWLFVYLLKVQLSLKCNYPLSPLSLSLCLFIYRQSLVKYNVDKLTTDFTKSLLLTTSASCLLIQIGYTIGILR